MKAGFSFEVLKTTLTNLMWILGLLGISLEVAPIKINPFTQLIKLIFGPFQEIMGHELQPVKDQLKDQKKEIDSIREHMVAREEAEDEAKLQEIRWKILSFGDQLRATNEATKETYEYIMGLHDTYQKEIVKQERTNGVMDVTWDFILKKYNSHIENNDFIG